MVCEFPLYSIPNVIFLLFYQLSQHYFQSIIRTPHYIYDLILDIGELDFKRNLHDDGTSLTKNMFIYIGCVYLLLRKCTRDYKNTGICDCGHFYPKKKSLTKARFIYGALSEIREYVPQVIHLELVEEELEAVTVHIRVGPHHLLNLRQQKDDRSKSIFI